MPARLRNEALLRGLQLETTDIFLGRYISFHDQVTLSDVSKALNFAIEQQIPKGRRFICISHSTGGPLVRTWWRDFYHDYRSQCPMSHLIMLAPANHGSALAQLGKSRLSRVRSWFDGVEPGQGILDWLELGSAESWHLNKDWIFNGEKFIASKDVFCFVITAQDIDRKLYDHINSYTGELGSDGAVRVASANLNSTYMRLEQTIEAGTAGATADELKLIEYKEAPQTPLRILRKKSHSGDKMGIMRSVKNDTGDSASRELIEAIFDCVGVESVSDYNSITKKFAEETEAVQIESKIELEIRPIRKKLYIHDRYSMIIFRVHDTEGRMVPDFDLILTAGDNDPDLLPTGFFADRQINRVNLSTVTYFVNYEVMNGTAEVIDPDGEVVRKHIPGVDKLGLMVQARPGDGFIRYLPCKIEASREFFEKLIKPNSTTLIDIYLRRLVSEEIFRFEKEDGGKIFINVKPGERIVT